MRCLSRIDPSVRGRGLPILHASFFRSLLAAGGVALCLLLVSVAVHSPPAQCSGLCQGCYCDQIINGTCMVNGQPSGCIGCVGSCTSPTECQCQAGRGGCGAVIAWCRSTDCAPQPTPAPTATPVMTPTPTPPACDERIYNHIEAPQVVDWLHRPDFPTVIGQDPTLRGFDLLIDARGGYAEQRQVALFQTCPDGATDPALCPDTWQWQCSERVLARYDDPIVAVDLAMRLADSSVDWLRDDLSVRYPGASHKEGLPRTFDLWRGSQMQVNASLLRYPAQDPGVHGGLIWITTQGTPLHPPQQVAAPYEVKVHLVEGSLRWR